MERKNKDNQPSSEKSPLDGIDEEVAQVFYREKYKETFRFFDNYKINKAEKDQKSKEFGKIIDSLEKGDTSLAIEKILNMIDVNLSNSEFKDENQESSIETIARLNGCLKELFAKEKEVGQLEETDETAGEAEDSKANKPERKKVEVERDIRSPMEEEFLQDERRAIEEYEESIQPNEETKDKFLLFFSQKEEAMRRDYLLKWFEKHKKEFKDEGNLVNISDEMKIGMAAKRGAIKELIDSRGAVEGFDYTKEFLEMENLKSIILDLKSSRTSSESLVLSLNYSKKIEKEMLIELQKAEASGDKGAVFAMQQKLNNLFGARQELAEKISGRDLEQEADGSQAIKEWETNNGYTKDKKAYTDGRYQEEIDRRFPVAGIMSEEDRRKKRGRDYNKIRNYDIAAQDVLGYTIRKKGRISKKTEIVDKEGNVVVEFEKENDAVEFLKVKIEASIRDRYDKEWDGKNQERNSKIDELIGKEVEILAKSPEKAIGGIETVYAKVRDKLAMEYIEKKLKKEKKSAEQLEKIKEQFGGSGKNLTDYISAILEREGSLEGLTGDLDDDQAKIAEFLEDSGIKVDQKELKGFFKEKGKNYEDIVKKQKGFLWWMMEITSGLLSRPERKKQK